MERPARAFLVDLLRSCDAVHVAGEAGSGEAGGVRDPIRTTRPGLARFAHALLEARLDPGRFVRLARGVLVNGDLIARMAPMPGSTYVAVLATGQNVSRMRSRVLRNTLLELQPGCVVPRSPSVRSRPK